MKIKHIHIKNFKSIKNLEIDLTDMNAFIGANNAGKSNIFSAINFLLGRTYPMPGNLTKEMHYNSNDNNKIFIEILFDNNSIVTFDEKLEKYNFSIKNRISENKYNNDEREKYCIAYFRYRKKGK